jgi:formylglycine-generating enzyme required for sulfatase activity
MAVAGADQTVGVGAVVTLDGSGSSASSGGLHYHWTSPSGVTLSDTTAARPTFAAPSLAGDYRFALVVSDGLSASVSDEVVVAVKGRPVAVAGADQTVAVGTVVTLDGSGSSASSGGVLRYHWTLPPGVTLSDTTAARPTFTALSAGEYWFGLVVGDGLSSSVSDEVVVTVKTALDPGEVRRYTLASGVAMDFVWVPSGTFAMGSPSTEAGRYGDDGPQHEVMITRGFWLGRTELTQGQWQVVMGTTPWVGQYGVQENADHPAVYISWEDVQELVDRLNQSAGAGVYRLPTEAEWEYACRAGTTTRWSFGDDEAQLGNYAWYEANAWNAGRRYGQPVGMKLPNPWGLYDLHGNMWEWCQDWRGSYSSDAQTDPQGPASGSYRVLRGGAINYSARDTRSASRFSNAPSDRNLYISARLLRTR